MVEVREPYKPHHIIQTAEVPAEIKNIPRDDGEVAAAARYIFQRRKESQNLLPKEYLELETWFADLYESQY